MEVEEYKKDLLNCDIKQVHTKYIIVGDVWYFKCTQLSNNIETIKPRTNVTHE